MAGEVADTSRESRRATRKPLFPVRPRWIHEKLPVEQMIASATLRTCRAHARVSTRIDMHHGISGQYTFNLDHVRQSGNNSLERVFGATFRSVIPLAYSRENVHREGPP